jgi:hypothetical protein
MGVEPLGDGRHVTADLVELDNAECLITAVVLNQRLETLCGGKVFEGQRSLSADLAPQDAVAVPERFFWAWMLATTLTDWLRLSASRSGPATNGLTIFRS